MEPRFDHLVRLTDGTGLIEHARLAVPRRQHGYTTDDNSRALIAVCREPEPPEELARLADTYLAFLQAAQRSDGRFRNRLSYRRTWEDHTDTDDASGRAMWALGTAAARAPWPWVAEAAEELFARGASFRSPHLRSNSFAVLGAAELVAARGEHGPAAGLLERAAVALAEPVDDPEWPWPEPALAYDNARIPEALLAAGEVTGEERSVEEGLRLLGWLVEVQTRNGHLSPVPHVGWRRGGRRHRFDQQPVEAAALADAAHRAWVLTGDGSWAEVVERAAAWFLGHNDLGVAMCDPHTGGAYDGLTPGGPNRNQGAESTVALITTLQRAREVASSPGRRAVVPR